MAENKCPLCGHANAPGKFACDACGAILPTADKNLEAAAFAREVVSGAPPRPIAAVPTVQTPPSPAARPIVGPAARPAQPGNPQINLTQAGFIFALIIGLAFVLVAVMNRPASVGGGIGGIGGDDVFVGSFRDGQNSLAPATARLAEEVASKPSETRFHVRWTAQGKVTSYPEITYDKSAGTLEYKLTAGGDAPAWRYTGVKADALQKLAAAGGTVTDLDSYGATETFTK